MAPVLAQCRPPRRVRFDAEARRKHAPTNGGGPEGAPAWKAALRSSASPGRRHAGTMLKEEAVTKAKPMIWSLAPAMLLSAAGQVPTGKPEEAGMSTERLQRIHQAVQRHIDAGAISGVDMALHRLVN